MDQTSFTTRFYVRIIGMTKDGSILSIIILEMKYLYAIIIAVCVEIWIKSFVFNMLGTHNPRNIKITNLFVKMSTKVLEE